MNDPYIQKNGTLINKLGISNSKNLKQAEIDITYFNLISAINKLHSKCVDIALFKAIHSHIFKDIFDWAGNFRTIPIQKKEIAIHGLSLKYSNPENIERDLQKTVDDLNACNWKNLNVRDFAGNFTPHLAKIWKIHPFREGNTRTVLTFAHIFSKQHGFDMDFSYLLDNLDRKYDSQTGMMVGYNIRDKFALAAFDGDLSGIFPLECVIYDSIKNGKSKEFNNNCITER